MIRDINRPKLINKAVTMTKPKNKQNRTKTIQIRVTPDEKRSFEQIAKAAGLKVSAYVILTILHDPRGFRTTDPRALRILTKIEQAISELARKYTYRADSMTIPDRLEILLALRAIQKEIK